MSVRLVAGTCRRRHERYHQGPVRGMTEGVDLQRLNCLFLVDVGVVGLYKQSVFVCVCIRALLLILHALQSRGVLLVKGNPKSCYCPAAPVDSDNMELRTAGQEGCGPGLSIYQGRGWLALSPEVTGFHGVGVGGGLQMESNVVNTSRVAAFS